MTVRELRQQLFDLPDQDAPAGLVHAVADLVAECQRANADPNSQGVDCATVDRAAAALRRIEPATEPTPTDAF